MAEMTTENKPLCFVCAGIYTDYQCPQCPVVKGREDEIMLRNMLPEGEKRNG